MPRIQQAQSFVALNCEFLWGLHTMALSRNKKMALLAILLCVLIFAMPKLSEYGFLLSNYLSEQPQSSHGPNYL
jgi:hypothetical protein